MGGSEMLKFALISLFYNLKLEGCIDDERQFKTAKRSQEAPAWWRHCSETVFPR